MTNQLIITPIQPFSFKECLFFLARSEHECLFKIQDERLIRAVQIGTRTFPISVSQSEANLAITIPQNCTRQEEIGIKDYVEHWLDTNRDLQPFYSLLIEQTALSELATKYKGLRLIGIPDLFEAMCWSIIGQQINLTFAYKLKLRLVEAYGASINYEGQKLYHFPTPEALVNLDEDFLKTQQFSRGKIQYLKNVATAFLEDGLNKSVLAQIPDFETRQKQLTKIKGIGIWSANYALMKTIHQPEAIPFGDTGLTQALFNLKIIEDRKDEKGIIKFFETMRNWEAYTVFYLWRSLAG